MKMQKLLGFLLPALIVALALSITPAKADGGIFYPPGYYTAETTQKAFIYYSGQTENLVIVSSFKGNAKDFAWIIPTPSLPTIDKAKTGLFNNLSEITHAAGALGPVYGVGFGLSGSLKSAPVEVVSEKTVGNYDTAVLKATDENALAIWLSNHGYSFPKDKSANLKSYVDEGWYFAIAKIRPELVSSTEVANQLSEGTLTPLRLTFQTDKIIYPMKLTGIALTQTSTITQPTDIGPPVPFSVSNVPVILYILSDHKTEQGKLSTNWANWINAADIGKLNDSLEANIIPTQKLFLTKMSGSFNANNISDDFSITKASDDNVYPTPVYKTSEFWFGNLLALILTPIAIVFFPIPLGLIFMVFIILQTYVKKKWLHIFGSVYQILACLTLLAVGLAIVSENGSDLSGFVLENGVIGATISVVAFWVLGIYATVKMFKHYKKSFSK